MHCSICEPFQVIPYFSSILPHLLASYNNMCGSQLTHLNQICIDRALIFRIRPPDALSPNSDWSTFSSIQVVIVVHGKDIEYQLHELLGIAVRDLH